MEKAKNFLIERIKQDLEHDEVMSEKIEHLFKTPEDLKKYIEFFYGLAEHNQRYMNALNNFIHDKKYHKRKGRALGLQSKAMPHSIYEQLIKYVGLNVGEKQKLALEFEGIEGARGEDLVQLKESDLDFNSHVVKIHNQKRDRWYQLPINEHLEKELKKFISDHHQDIVEHHGFVFYSLNPVQKSDHLSEKYLKNVVFNALQDLKLNKTYGIASNGRKLYLYTLHSLRGHCATQIMNKTNDLRVVQEVLDHQPNSANVTMLYLERNENQLKKALR